MVNGQKVFVDQNKSIVPTIKDGRTFVPLSFVTESLGLSVNWDPKMQEIIVE